MMGVLSSFLNETGRAWRDAAGERDAHLADWRDAVGRLFEAVRGWLLLADPDRLLQLDESEVELFESRLGRYRLPALTISLGPRLVHFVPVARSVLQFVPGDDGAEQKAAGCVAVSDSQEVSSRSPNYRLYRSTAPAGDRWYVAADNPADVLFTREVFERMLVGLLR